jgi:hypothetical protein
MKYGSVPKGLPGGVLNRPIGGIAAMGSYPTGARV